jgi:leucyl-tRNA---protein transferase
MPSDKPVQFVNVINEPENCPYLPGQRMHLPFRMPTRRLTLEEFDLQLEQGDRRSGPLLYKPTCASCNACEAIRVGVTTFSLSRSQRRVWNRNHEMVSIQVVRPTVSPRHLELYNRHSRERGLSLRAEYSTERDYRFFLMETCVDTWEVQYHAGGKLIGVSILDFGALAVSSVYHYFDPDESWRSLGVYSVLREIALCAERGIEWYYLGLYVAACSHLSYKADYLPNQRRIQGVWQDFKT